MTELFADYPLIDLFKDNDLASCDDLEAAKASLQLLLSQRDARIEKLSNLGTRNGFRVSTKKEDLCALCAFYSENVRVKKTGEMSRDWFEFCVDTGVFLGEVARAQNEKLTWAILEDVKDHPYFLQIGLCYEGNTHRLPIFEDVQGFGFSVVANGLLDECYRSEFFYLYLRHKVLGLPHQDQHVLSTATAPEATDPQVRPDIGVDAGVVVGALADAIGQDEDAAAWLREDFRAINDILTIQLLPAHTEPETCEVWSGHFQGYRDLSALKEIAGLVWLGKPIPRERSITGEDDTPHGDALADAVLALVREGVGVDDVRLPPFAHLGLHDDTGGFYVPVDFVHPLFPEGFKGDVIDVWPVGSVPRLAQEIAALKTHLGVPDDLVADSTELVDLLLRGLQNSGGALWEAQPVATHCALVLETACKISMRTGAAIKFE